MHFELYARTTRANWAMNSKLKMFWNIFWSTKLAAVVMLMTTPTFAAPAVVHSCDPKLDSIGNLVEAVRSFANGAIRVAHISTEEPAAASEHLLIFVQTREGMGSDCFAVSVAPYDNGYYRGYYALDFAKLQASYDEQKGLLLLIPASVNDQNGNEKRVGDIKVRINRKNDNSVTTEK